MSEKVEKFQKPIFVTKPFLPPLEEYCEGLCRGWASQER
jgi:hypothetical protein